MLNARNCLLMSLVMLSACSGGGANASKERTVANSAESPIAMEGKGKSEDRAKDGASTQAANVSVAASLPSTTTAKDMQMDKTIPDTFSSYGNHSLSDGAVCAAGAVVDEDGMNQQPIVYLKGRDGQVRWVNQLALPANAYQARATGCLQQGDHLYVLVQGDTQSEQSLSQTLLSVVEIGANDGSARTVHAVAVPDVSGAYSAWVESESGFAIRDGDLVINGLYFRLDDRENQQSFETTVKINH